MQNIDNPPKLPLRFFRWYCHPKLLRHIEGDLMELYSERVKDFGKRKANRKFIIDVLLLFRPGIIRPTEYENLNTYAMYKSYFKVGWRNILRHRTFSILTILGLATGIAACFMLIQYNIFEMSFDDFHANRKNIYRLGVSISNEGKLQAKIPKNFSALGPALKNDMPEIKEYVRIFPIDGSIAVKRNDVVFNEKNILFADASFLEVFSFKVVEGDALNALKEPYSLVISQSTAKKYFSDGDPIGKQLTMREGVIDRTLVVKAVVEDVPENSHLTFDILISHATLSALWGERADHSWDEALFYTYILVTPETNLEALQRKLTPGLIGSYSGWKPPAVLQFVIQPLQDIYLYSDLVQEARVNGSGKQVRFLWIIALLIVMLAWINYINLSTARSIERAKEVGIRKIIGAKKFQLFQQFIFESLLLNILSVIAAFIIVQCSWPVLNSFLGKSIPLSGSPLLILALVVFFILGSVISAFIPSLVLSSLKSVSIIKGKFTSSFSGLSLRKSLVVFQFTASIALLAVSFIVFLQMKYMRSTDLGADINQTLVLQNPDIVDSTFNAKVDYFKSELMMSEGIDYVVSSSSIPGKPDNIIQGGLQRVDRSDENGFNHYNFRVDRNFIDAFKIKILTGRNFSAVSDNQSVLINKTAANLLGYEKPEDAVGERIVANWTPEKTVIGVVEDFHQQSLRSAYDPIVFSLDDSGQGYYSIKLNLTAHERSLGNVISQIKDKWNTAFPSNPFDFFFLDDYFDDQYKDDLRFEKILYVFSGLTLFIACLGILGLSIFHAAQRKKEIGIRKVLGASVSNILMLLSSEYGKMNSIALLIALPITYYYIDMWLQGFAFRIAIQWWMLIVPGSIVLMISMLVVSSQSIKTALADPVKSLRSE